MPPPQIPDEVAEKIASYLARKQLDADIAEANVGPNSRVPLGWVLGGAGTLIALTILCANAYADLNAKLSNVVTVKYIRLYSRDFELKNPNIKAPNADEIHDRMNP